MQVAGWVGIWVALVAFYAATAILTGEVYGHVSPLPHCCLPTAAALRGAITCMFAGAPSWSL